MLIIGCSVALVAELVVSSPVYTVTINKTGTGTGTITCDNGTITWSGNTGTVSFDNITTEVHFTPTAATGAVFGSWSGCDSVSNNICALTPTDNKSITATFNGVNVYTLTVRIAGFGRGTIRDSSGAIYLSNDNITTSDNVTTSDNSTRDNVTTSDNSSFVSYNFNMNRIVYLTATPKTNNYMLSLWSGCDRVYDNGTCAITMSTSRTVTGRFSGAYNVTYNIPYVVPDTNGVIYCVVSNFSLDNATTDGLAVMSFQGGVASQNYYYFPSNLSIKRKRTTFLMFYSNNAVIGDNLTIYDNSTHVDYSSEVSGNYLYGVKLKFTSTGGIGISGINCKNILMACFQGDTTPKRNLAGYTCEDNSAAGPGRNSIIVGY
ncbi:MAG: hypothetical protein HQK94_16105 [Nitrospirae bacterium]|nr:hypothetical protein [Nitrospirota bacterium]MBF0535359.1 hypothetical protein [Nitrospirota bacterium]